MKKVLCVCNTYYQVIVAMQYALSKKGQEECSIIISDHCRNSEETASRLREMHIFQNVLFVKTKALESGKSGIVKRLRKLAMLIHPHGHYFDGLRNQHFDQLLFNNYNVSVHLLFDVLYKNNPQIQCFRFEEGIIFYNHKNVLDLKTKLAYKIRSFLHQKNLSDLVTEFYCFYPELYVGNLKAIALPNIQKADYPIYQKLFGTNEMNLSYPQKFIYFSCMLDMEGGEPIGEIAMINTISNLIGAENLLVKIHPRDDPKRFVKAGIEVDLNSSVPWEAIQLSSDFSNHIFLTATSGSVVSTNLIVERAPVTLFLYPLFGRRNNPIWRASVKSVDQLLHKLISRHIGDFRVIKTMPELESLLKQYLSEME